MFDGAYTGTLAPDADNPPNCGTTPDGLSRTGLVANGHAMLGVNLRFEGNIEPNGSVAMQYLNVGTLNGRFAGKAFAGVLRGAGGLPVGGGTGEGGAGTRAGGRAVACTGAGAGSAVAAEPAGRPRSGNAASKRRRGVRARFPGELPLTLSRLRKLRSGFTQLPLPPGLTARQPLSAQTGAT